MEEVWCQFTPDWWARERPSPPTECGPTERM